VQSIYTAAVGGTCPSCGHANPDGARFCSSCGASLTPAPAPHEERKLVSVLFVDLVGFTSRSDQADPEDVRNVLRAYHARARAPIEQYGGSVEKFIGDAVMAVFGAPLSHGDDAERAVRAGLAVLDAINELNRDQPGIDLHARSMYVCVLNQDGDIVMHRNMKASPDTFLRTVAPYRDDLVVAVECVFTWYWLADLGQAQPIDFVLGHALYDPIALAKRLPSGKDVFGDGTPAHRLPQIVSIPTYTVLIVGTLWSAWKMRGRPELRERFLGTLLIAFGATIVAVGGSAFAAAGTSTRAGRVSYSGGHSAAGAGALAAAAAAEAGGEAFAPHDEAQPEAMPVVEQRVVGEEQMLGRNDPCWCGSGKKFKRCHGA